MAKDGSSSAAEALEKANIPFTEAMKKLRNSIAHSADMKLSDELRRALISLDGKALNDQSRFESAMRARESPKIFYEIKNLEEQARKQAQEIEKHAADKTKAAREIDKLRGIIEELNQKKNIQHLLNSVSEDAHQSIEENLAFRELFTSESEVDSFVVSVDIRRSTELMLKARSPRLFAQFITTLCRDLEEIFKRNWAVVDKFTGDGILAFFPEFYTGEDAGYLALKAASEANAAFAKRYKEFRTSFSTVLRDVGLGTGIDFGRVHLVRMAGALTIVGQPVVYACRMGGAPAGRILLNQPAYEVIAAKYPHLTVIEESVIDIKGEGALIAYDAQLSAKKYEPVSPSWIKKANQTEGLAVGSS
jgi:class 3 adenylate cyclase